MTDDKEPRLRRLEDAIEAFLDRDQTASGEDLLANNEELADLIRPMLDHGTHDALAQDSFDATPVAGLRDVGRSGEVIRRIGDLDVIREIGRGGMGIVFEAVDRLLKRRVAVKIMLRAADMSASSIVRFRREAELAASLSHPSIVPVHALSETGDEFYLSMGLIESASLADVLSALRRGHDGPDASSITPQVFDDAVDDAIHSRFADAAAVERVRGKSHILAVVELLRQVADALTHAHQKGIIHRDVKPANILIDGAGRAFLTDFGLACVQGDPRVTQMGASPGTPQYMAPEQVNDERGALGPATDVFALGVTFYEALTLRRAFPGETLPAVLFAVAMSEPVDPVTLNQAVSPDLVAILQRALQKDPADRYPTAQGFAEDLSAFLRGDPVSVRALPWSSRIVRRVWRDPWRLAVMLLLVLAIPVVIALSLSSGKRDPQAEVGEQVLLDRWLDEQLSNGFREAGEGDAEAARACFDAILAKDPTSEGAIAGMSAMARRDGDRAALLVLQEHGLAISNSTALLRRRAALLSRLGEESASQAALGLPEEIVDFDAFLLGYGLLELGHSGLATNFGEARRMLHRAIVTADRPRPLYYYEWLHAAAHDLHEEDAESAMAAILRLWPDDSTGQFWVSFAHKSFGRDGQAIDSLKKALALEPMFQTAAVNLVTLLRRTGRNEEALRLLREVLPGAPRPAELIAQIGALLVALRKVPEALAELSAALKVYPDSVAIRTNYAGALMLANQIPEAEEQLLQVLKARPQDLGARFSLATVQFRKGDAKSARQNLESVLAYQPSASGFYQLGLACTALEDGAAALRAYERCLELDKDHSQALVNLANLRLRAGNKQSAERLLRRAIAVDRKLLPAQRMLLRVLDDRPADAVTMCREWAKHTPDAAEPLRYLASSLVRTKDKDLLPEALKLATIANSMTSQRDGPTMHILGVVELAIGNAIKAKETVTRAMGLLDPKDRFTSYYRQQMAATLEECELALQQWKQPK